MSKPKPFLKFSPVSPRAIRHLGRPLFALGVLCSLAGCALFGGGESVATARAQATPLPTATAAPTQVSREGNALVYTGPLAADANAAAQHLYSAEVRRLVINSRGGAREAAMALGEWVFERGLDVEVSGACLAACAHYVFPAGRQKLLGASSQLGWYGSAAGQDGAERAAASSAATYFARLGVDPRALDWGLRPEYARHHAHCAGWRYGLAAMEQLGLRNIHVTAPRWQPADLVDERCIFVIDTLAPAAGGY